MADTIPPLYCDSDSVVETQSARLWLGKDGIARVAMFPGRVGSLDDAIENVAAVARLGGGVCRPLLVDIRADNSQSREARLYYSSNPETLRVVSAVALLVDSPLSRMLANIMISLSRGKMPFRLVSSETEGLTWLRGFIR